MDEKQCMDMAVKIQEVNSRTKSNEHRIEECETEIKDIKTETKLIYELTVSIKSIANSISDLQTDIKEVKTGQKQLNDKVNTLENQPAKKTYERWEKIAYEVIKWLVIGTVGFFVARIGLF